MTVQTLYCNNGSAKRVGNKIIKLLYHKYGNIGHTIHTLFMALFCSGFNGKLLISVASKARGRPDMTYSL